MNKQDAKALLAKQLEAWRQRPYADLASLVDGDPHTVEVSGEEGDWYQCEIQVFWDRDPGGGIRVSGAIDDGGIRAFVPLTDGFIMAPDGSFIGEDSV